MSAVRALIGYTGFVGSGLNRPGRFTHLYNSANSPTMVGESFDQVICAGVSAAKWIANGDPDGDWAAIERLTRVLEQVETKQFILISTIDVYPDPSSGEDETAILDGDRNHAYGRNRLRLERWAAERFADCRIIRLPALFGAGLKKNAIYDLLHDNQIEKINPAGRFQWYPTARLWDDIGRVVDAGIELVNLFPEAVPMSTIIDRCFPGAKVAQPVLPAPAYALKTGHAAIFGGRDGYLMPADQVLTAIESFVAAERSGRV